jgi:hypothetical protein
MGKTKSAISNAKGLFSFTFEAEAWRVWLRWLATYAGIFIPQKWLGTGLRDNVLIEKLALVRSSMGPNIE